MYNILLIIILTVCVCVCVIHMYVLCLYKECHEIVAKKCALGYMRWLHAQNEMMIILKSSVKENRNIQAFRSDAVHCVLFYLQFAAVLPAAFLQLLGNGFIRLAPHFTTLVFWLAMSIAIAPVHFTILYGPSNNYNNNRIM